MARLATSSTTTVGRLTMEQEHCRQSSVAPTHTTPALLVHYSRDCVEQ